MCNKLTQDVEKDFQAAVQRIEGLEKEKNTHPITTWDSYHGTHYSIAEFHFYINKVTSKKKHIKARE